MVEKGKLGEKLYQVFVCAQAKAMEKPIKPKQWSKLEPNERLSWSEVAAAAWANTCNPEACEHIATNAQAFQAKVAEQEKRHAAEIKKLEERRVRMELEQVDPSKELDGQISDGIKLAANMRDLRAMAKLCGLRLQLQQVLVGIPAEEPVDEPPQ
jgi:hypothetical protein